MNTENELFYQNLLAPCLIILFGLGLVALTEQNQRLEAEYKKLKEKWLMDDTNYLLDPTVTKSLLIIGMLPIILTVACVMECEPELKRATQSKLHSFFQAHKKSNIVEQASDLIDSDISDDELANSSFIRESKRFKNMQ